jgi:hypothetical protein
MTSRRSWFALALFGSSLVVLMSCTQTVRAQQCTAATTVKVYIKNVGGNTCHTYLTNVGNPMIQDVVTVDNGWYHLATLRPPSAVRD